MKQRGKVLFSLWSVFAVDEVEHNYANARGPL